MPLGTTSPCSLPRTALERAPLSPRHGGYQSAGDGDPSFGAGHEWSCDIDVRSAGGAREQESSSQSLTNRHASPRHRYASPPGMHRSSANRYEPPDNKHEWSCDIDVQSAGEAREQGSSSQSSGAKYIPDRAIYLSADASYSSPDDSCRSPDERHESFRDLSANRLAINANQRP